MHQYAQYAAVHSLHSENSNNLTSNCIKRQIILMKTSQTLNEKVQSFPTHIKQNMLINTYRTQFRAHKCQKSLLHLSWNWRSDYLWWKNCFSWQTAAQVLSNGIQNMLRLLTWLWTAILQREFCYCQATVFLNQMTSLFWQMQDSCPFTLRKIRIQPFWDVTICDRYEGHYVLTKHQEPPNVLTKHQEPPTQRHSITPQHTWILSNAGVKTWNLALLLISLWRKQ